MIKPRQLTLSAGCILIGMFAIPFSAASASSVYYNIEQAYSDNIGTDNSTVQDGYVSDFLYDDQGRFVGYDPIVPFAGWNTSSSFAPFGFSNERLNWAAEITASGDALTVSSQDAHDRYGIWADIDTAKGAWFDGAKGWEHQTDVGLIKSDVDTVITLNISGIENPNARPRGLWTNFGVSVYSGMPEGKWMEHGAWNCVVNCLSLYARFQDDNPLSLKPNTNTRLTEGGMSYITHSGTVDSDNSISFNASAGTVYTILLGGNSGASNFSPQEGYAVNIATAAPVPVPTALWLFGGALLSLTGAVRKKRQMV